MNNPDFAIKFVEKTTVNSKPIRAIIGDKIFAKSTQFKFKNTSRGVLVNEYLPAHIQYLEMKFLHNEQKMA